MVSMRRRDVGRVDSRCELVEIRCARRFFCNADLDTESSRARSVTREHCRCWSAVLSSLHVLCHRRACSTHLPLLRECSGQIASRCHCSPANLRAKVFGELRRDNAGANDAPSQPRSRVTCHRLAQAWMRVRKLLQSFDRFDRSLELWVETHHRRYRRQFIRSGWSSLPVK